MNEATSVVATAEPALATPETPASRSTHSTGAPSGEPPAQSLEPPTNPSVIKKTKPLKSLSKPKGFLNFSHKLFRERLELKRESVLCPSVILDYSFLNQLGLESRVREYIQAIGWESLFECEHDTYLELCLEFFPTFNVAKVAL